MRSLFQIVLFCSFLAPQAYASESLVFKIESLLREGAVEQAEPLLKSSELEKKTYYKLLGRIAALKNETSKSVGYFKKAIKLGEKSSSVILTLSQSLLKLEKSDEALNLLTKLKENSIQKDILYAQALWTGGDRYQAVTYLKDLKSRKYTSYDLIERQKYYYLFEMGLFKKIFEETKKYYKIEGRSSEAGLYAVSLFKENDRFLAEQYFDLLQVLKPGDALLFKERGVFELEKGRKYLASLSLSKAAHLDSQYSFEAAAAYLSLGKHTQAKFFNSKVKDAKKKVLQNFTIYLDSEEYEKAMALKYDLEKQGHLEEDKVVYALMYTAFKVKDYKSFSDLFYKISSKVYVAKVLRLKRIIDGCKKSVGLSCVFS